MRKLRLEVEALRVESFEVEKDQANRGTVRGASPDVGVAPPDTDAACYGGGASGWIGCISNSQCVSPTPCNSCWFTCQATCSYPGGYCA